MFGKDMLLRIDHIPVFVYDLQVRASLKIRYEFGDAFTDDDLKESGVNFCSSASQSYILFCIVWIVCDFHRTIACRCLGIIYWIVYT